MATKAQRTLKQAQREYSAAHRHLVWMEDRAFAGSKVCRELLPGARRDYERAMTNLVLAQREGAPR